MLSEKEIRLTIRRVLLTGAIVPVTDIAFQSRTIDPIAKDIYIRETLLPVEEIPLAQGNPQYSGIMVYDIFTKSATGTETIELKADELKALYPLNITLEGANTRIAIERVSRKGIFQDGVWQFLPVHIVFNAYDS